MGDRRNGFTSVVALVASFGLAACAGGPGDGPVAKGTTDAVVSATTTTTAPDPEPSPTRSTARTVKIPRCATKVSSAKDGYHVALPCGYTRLKDLSSLPKDTRERIKKRHWYITDGEIEGFTLYAADLSASRSTVSLLVSPAAGDPRQLLTGLRKAARESLTALDAKKIVFSTVSVAGEAAVRVTCELPALGQVDQTLHVTLVTTVHDGKMFGWRFTGNKRPRAAEKFVLRTFGYL